MGLKIKYKKGNNYITENIKFFISFLINRHNNICMLNTRDVCIPTELFIVTSATWQCMTGKKNVSYIQYANPKKTPLVICTIQH